MAWYNRNPHVDRAKLLVSYNNHTNEWNIISDHIAPGGVLARSSKKKDLVKEAKKVAKHESVKPSKLIIENKNWSSQKDQRTHRYD